MEGARQGRSRLATAGVGRFVAEQVSKEFQPQLHSAASATVGNAIGTDGGTCGYANIAIARGSEATTGSSPISANVSDADTAARHGRWWRGRASPYPGGGMATAAKARKTRREKRKGPQMTQGRADSASTHVRLEAQGHCAAGQAPAHSRYLRPFAFFALSLASFYRLPGATAGQLGLCQRAWGRARGQAAPWRHCRGGRGLRTTW
jgi:hypothetical protein